MQWPLEPCLTKAKQDFFNDLIMEGRVLPQISDQNGRLANMHDFSVFVSSNPALDLEQVLDNLDWCWNWSALCKNPNLTLDFVKRLLATGRVSAAQLDWSRISLLDDVTYEVFLNNLELPFAPNLICANPNFSIEQIDSLEVLCPHRLNYLSNPRILNNPELLELLLYFTPEHADTMELIYSRFLLLFQNPKLTLTHITSYWRNISWNDNHLWAFANVLSNNPNLNEHWINCPWLRRRMGDWFNWTDILKNPNISCEYIEQHFDRLPGHLQVFGFYNPNYTRHQNINDLGFSRCLKRLLPWINPTIGWGKLDGTSWQPVEFGEPYYRAGYYYLLDSISRYYLDRIEHLTKLRESWVRMRTLTDPDDLQSSLFGGIVSQSWGRPKMMEYQMAYAFSNLDDGVGLAYGQFDHLIDN